MKKGNYNEAFVLKPNNLTLSSSPQKQTTKINLESDKIIFNPHKYLRESIP